jgi:hypothetical protein
MNQNQEELEKLEEELKAEESSEEVGHRVSGRSVFELQRIITKKGERDESGARDKTD